MGTAEDSGGGGRGGDEERWEKHPRLGSAAQELGGFFGEGRGRRRRIIIGWRDKLIILSYLTGV